MKRTTARIITISDLVQWNEKKELELSPKYQRNNVWNDNARSYLIDSIIRGLPIPPIFLRQQVDITTRRTNREVIDGQQRVRTIIDFVVGETFTIKKSHNKEYGGKVYSSLDPDTQEQLLEYEILAEVVNEKDDSIVYDMFARLNSNNIVLNKQEVRNAQYWGEFKVLAYKLSSRYRDFFLSNQLFSDRDCSRMKDVEMVNSMIIILLDGIISETPPIIDSYYKKYDKEIPERDEVEHRYNKIMDVIAEVYDYFMGAPGCFGNKNYFFTMYAAITNQMYGIYNLDLPRNIIYEEQNIQSNMKKLKTFFSNFIAEFEQNLDDKDSYRDNHALFLEFAKNHSTRTTSRPERINRIAFLNEMMAIDEE